MAITNVKISELPPSVQLEIPLSVRSYKDEYEISELPFDVQFLIEEYLKREELVEYDFILDAKPNSSPYGDFEIISNVHDLVLEYLKNYFMVGPFDYPFDPTFGSRLKFQIHKLDTSIRQSIISNEVSNIVKILSEDIDIPITVTELSIEKSSTTGMEIDYIIGLKVLVNDIERNLVLQV